jgi:CheY-like chemotaxis protein
MNASPVLIAEDNPSDAILLERMLKGGRILNPLQILTDGQQVIDYLQAASADNERRSTPWPALLLLDLLMPTPGTKVLRWLNESGLKEHLATVVLTDKINYQEIRSAYSLGANSFLTKPVTQVDFMNMLHGSSFLRCETTASGIIVAHRKGAPQAAASNASSTR